MAKTGDEPLSGFAPGSHRLDESAAGYSSAGCAPAEPASASPGEYEYALQSSCRSRSFHPTANSVLTVCVSSGGKRIETPGISTSWCFQLPPTGPRTSAMALLCSSRAGGPSRAKDAVTKEVIHIDTATVLARRAIL